MGLRSAIAIAVCAACAAGAASTAHAGGAERDWSLRVAARDPVPYRGVDGHQDNAGGSGMLYPGGLIGLVAGVATHAVMINASRDNARTESEKQADKVIDPFRPDIAHFTQQDLATSALQAPGLRDAVLLAAPAGGTDDKAEGRMVDSAPLFWMTQERDALLLDNAVVVNRPGAKPYRNTIRVVSAAHPRKEAETYWSADGARALKAESVHLMAMSLEIALQQSDAPAGDAVPYRTVRYLQGEKELFERAQLLDEHCGRALIRNLRGGLMSVPLARPSTTDQAACADGAPR